MSLTPLLLPPPPKKVQLWGIFFALLGMNASLPTELKFRENTTMNNKDLYM